MDLSLPSSAEKKNLSVILPQLTVTSAAGTLSIPASSLSALDMRSKLSILNRPEFAELLGEDGRQIVQKLTHLHDHEAETVAIMHKDDNRITWTQDARIPRAVAEKERYALSQGLGLTKDGSSAEWDEINAALSMHAMLSTLLPTNVSNITNVLALEQAVQKAALTSDATKITSYEQLLNEVGPLYVNHGTSDGSKALTTLMCKALMPAAVAATTTTEVPLPQKQNSHCFVEQIEQIISIFPNRNLIAPNNKFICNDSTCVYGDVHGDEIEIPHQQGFDCLCQYVHDNLCNVITLCVCNNKCDYCFKNNARRFPCPYAYAKYNKIHVNLENKICPPCCKFCNNNSVEKKPRPTFNKCACSDSHKYTSSINNNEDLKFTHELENCSEDNLVCMYREDCVRCKLPINHIAESWTQEPKVPHRILRQNVRTHQNTKILAHFNY